MWGSQLGAGIVVLGVLTAANQEIEKCDNWHKIEILIDRNPSESILLIYDVEWRKVMGTNQWVGLTVDKERRHKLVLIHQLSQCGFQR